jgi:hypothetical protein
MKRQWRRLVTCMTLVAFLVTSAPAGMMTSLRSRAAAANICAAGCECRTSQPEIAKKSTCGCNDCGSQVQTSIAAVEADTASHPSKSSSCPCCPNCPGCCWCSIAKAPCVPMTVSSLLFQADLTEYVLDPSLLFPPIPCREITQPPKI